MKQAWIEIKRAAKAFIVMCKAFENAAVHVANQTEKKK